MVVLDAETSQCVHYEHVPYGKTEFELPAEVISAHRDMDVRIDLLDCGIDICTPDVRTVSVHSTGLDTDHLRRSQLCLAKILTIKNYERTSSGVF